MSDLDNYTPFGEEWKKEMMKWKKEDLIGFIRKLQSGTDDEKIALIQSVNDAQSICEGILNDFEAGTISKNKANNLLGDYTARISEIFWNNALERVKESALKVYRVEFNGVYPVGNCLVLTAHNQQEAEEMARKTITHTSDIVVNELSLKEPDIIEYLSGDY